MSIGLAVNKHMHNMTIFRQMVLVTSLWHLLVQRFLKKSAFECFCVFYVMKKMTKMNVQYGRSWLWDRFYPYFMLFFTAFLAVMDTNLVYTEMIDITETVEPNLWLPRLTYAFLAESRLHCSAACGFHFTATDPTCHFVAFSNVTNMCYFGNLNQDNSSIVLDGNVSTYTVQSGTRKHGSLFFLLKTLSFHVMIPSFIFAIL